MEQNTKTTKRNALLAAFGCAVGYLLGGKLLALLPVPALLPERLLSFLHHCAPMPGRIQVYLNRKLYDEIKNYLNVIAPEVSIASYISNIIAEHIELNIEEITRMYKDRFSPPKIQ